MDKKSVFLILASGLVGSAIGSQYPILSARAGLTEERPHVFSGVANVSLQEQIETGLAGLAVSHANSQLELSGDDALSFVPGVCPIEAIHLYCSVNSENIRSWVWEYKTASFVWTRTVGTPQ